VVKLAFAVFSVMPFHAFWKNDELKIVQPPTIFTALRDDRLFRAL